jgi:hypothetical protein
MAMMCVDHVVLVVEVDRRKPPGAASHRRRRKWGIDTVVQRR